MVNTSAYGSYIAGDTSQNLKGIASGMLAYIVSPDEVNSRPGRHPFRRVDSATYETHDLHQASVPEHL